MATVTLYVSSRLDDNKLTCATTGQIKKKIKSNLDDSMGEELVPVKAKTFLARGDKVHQQLSAILQALQEFDKIGCTKADRLFLWSTGDKDIVDVINQNSCESLQDNFTEQATKDCIHLLYKTKNDLSIRIGWQDKNKKNRFVDEAMKLIGERQSKLPTWENALQKARNMSNANESNR
jgi:hypothetical protein